MTALGLIASLRLCPRRLALFVALALAAPAASAAGGFDYYVLSLSWAPQYCAGAQHRDAAECAAHAGFIVHGLWPQSGRSGRCPARGWVSEAIIARMLPLMYSRGLIIHEWRAHGACTDLSPDEYFSQVERAARGIKVPPPYRAVAAPLAASAAQIKQAFVAANPELKPDALAVVCQAQELREVRICLDAGLQPRSCAADVRDQCPAPAVFLPVR